MEFFEIEFLKCKFYKILLRWLPSTLFCENDWNSFVPTIIKLRGQFITHHCIWLLTGLYTISEIISLTVFYSSVNTHSWGKELLLFHSEPHKCLMWVVESLNNSPLSMESIRIIFRIKRTLEITQILKVRKLLGDRSKLITRIGSPFSPCCLP